MNGDSTLRSMLNALDACANDLETFAGDPGIAYLVATRIHNIRVRLADMTARDLLVTVKERS